MVNLITIICWTIPGGEPPKINKDGIWKKIICQDRAASKEGFLFYSENAIVKITIGGWRGEFKKNVDSTLLYQVYLEYDQDSACFRVYETKMALLQKANDPDRNKKSSVSWQTWNCEHIL